MGCFSFGLRSKVRDNLSPETSVEVARPKSLSASSSSKDSKHWKKNGKSTTPLGASGSKQVSPGNTPFGGRPVPLPAPFSSNSLSNSRQSSLQNKSVSPTHDSSLKNESEENPTPSLKHSKSRRLSPKSSSNSLKATNSTRKELRSFTLAQLEAMTDGFSLDGFLGEGGFGAVYRGRMSMENSEVLVAVKVLNTDGNQGEKEWMAEVDFLSKLSHPNLVRLLGYCAEGQQRLLVYELLSRGSLEYALFRPPSPESPLPWNLRMKIAIGAARGLAYLHEEAEDQVIFRDFKTSNILLGRDWEPRLSDFGLARHGPKGDQTHITTKVVGTMGYAAPEYVMTGHLTSKSDVWGFGVVLLELLTGRLSLDKRKPLEEQNLVDWSMPYLKNPAKLYRIMDPDLSGRYSVRGAQIAASVVLDCLNPKPKLRPQMSHVVQTLLPVLDMHDMAGFTMQDLREPNFLRKKYFTSLKDGDAPAKC